ncbi:MAG TPA: DUF1203 domain-containing protein [Usitatibacter sp.]
MHFQISGLDPAQFAPFHAMSDEELARHRARRVTATEYPGYPCRVTLDDAQPGEELVLLNFEHLPVDSPYRSSHAIYVRANAARKCEAIDQVPPALERRLLSVRGFDANGLMISGEIVEGANLAPYVEAQLTNPDIAYLHAHYARRGCFAARIDRIA